MAKNMLDLGDPFVRELWSFILPTAFVLTFCLTLVPVPAFIRRFGLWFSSPFTKFLTIQEAEALQKPEGGHAAEYKAAPPPLWRTAVLTWLALFEVLVWLAFGCYRLVTDSSDIWGGVIPVIISLTWLYAALRPLVWPSRIAMYDLFSLYLIHIATSVLNFGGIIFDNGVYGIPLPPQLILLAHIANFAVLIILLVVILGMPIGVPSSHVNPDDIGKTVSPEDYCTLWQIISFHWVHPLIEKGTNTTLSEDDVWKLPMNNRSRPLFIQFGKLQGGGLLWKLWKANSFDLFLDLLLTFVSVLFNYAGPFFLQRILASIDHPTPENRSRAYIYAFMAFLSILCKVRDHNLTLRLL